MKRVRILRSGAIGDPGNTRAPVVHVKKGEIVELSDAAADMTVNVSKPPRAEYIDGKSEPSHEDGGDDERENADEGSGDDEKVSLIDRITGKGKGESSVLE